jgi:lipooligosaccharide transport system permease protein
MADTATTSAVTTGTPVPGHWRRALQVASVEALRYRRTWRGSIASAFLNPLLYLGAMGLGLGTLVDRGAGDVSLGDIAYAVYLAPGMLAAAAMQTGAMEGTWPVMAGIKWRKSYHAALATPVQVTDLLLGNTLWVAARLLMASVAFAAVVFVLGLAPLGGLLIALAPAVLAGLSMALPMTAFTAAVTKEANLSTMFRFGVIPMFLLSGAFFPVTQLPDPVAVIARMTPLYHCVELARAAALSVDTELAIAVHVAVPLAYAAAGGLLAQRRFVRRLVS